ncbi:MAG: hypothetical protein ACRD04_02660 [Terriglobales bacterium]
MTGGIDDKLRPIFSEVLSGAAGPPEQISRANTAEWHSVAHVGLVLAIEETLGLLLTESEMDELWSYAGAQAILSRRLGR